MSDFDEDEQTRDMNPDTVVVDVPVPGQWRTDTPTEPGTYLVTFRYRGESRVGERRLHCDHTGRLFWECNVIAWMPLPEPYRSKP